eukprot:TRINITY_DN66034_c0_g1_i1.p1 TRINITY_DN66034_c0_g1~~TRINITY_DN66034_c0_g1_i1.p1  ORF type:complete len:363 (+),score=67.27 TRINITY_DN66034_c0_g1_i1:149-1237(+)
MAARSRSLRARSAAAVPEADAPIVDTSLAWPTTLAHAACASEAHQAEDGEPAAFRVSVQASSYTQTNYGMRHGNEDRIMIHADKYAPHSADFHVIGVLDGHDTAEASDLVSRHLPSLLSSKLKEKGRNVVEAYTTVLAELEERLKSNRHASAGSCVLGCVISGRHVWCANLGDCRAVLLTLQPVSEDGEKKTGPKVSQLTWMSRDQKASTPSEQERIRRAGGTVVDGRVEGLEPSRTLGDFDVKMQVKKGVISIVPEVRRHDMGPQATQAILVCATDGVWDTLTGQDMCNLVAARKDIAQLQVAALGDVLNRNGDGKVSSVCQTQGVLHTLAEDLVHFSVAKGSCDDCTATVSLVTVAPART